MSKVLPLFVLALSIASSAAVAADYCKLNYASRAALVADICPHLKIVAFSVGNSLDGPGYSPTFREEFTWQNTGQKDIIALELGVLKWDPFNEAMIGSRLILPGRTDGGYRVLKPGEKDSDAALDYGHEHTYTAIGYVNRIRFGDGSVWTSDPVDLAREVKRLAPQVLGLGRLEPPGKPEEK
jgi:hypothetical protein